MSFFRYKRNLYPLFAIASALIIMVFGLIMARSIICSYFLVGAFVWLFIFGCPKQCLKALPAFIIVGGVFAVIAYYAADKAAAAALAMANRLGAVFVALIPGMSISAVAMTRCLSGLRTPRGVTLGMLITTSFVPVLGGEIKRVREAMKTRGAGSILNPKIFYRAFLIPLVTRIVDISDTLSVSIETRGFTLGKSKYTVYKKEVINVLDLLYLLGLVAGVVLVCVL